MMMYKIIIREMKMDIVLKGSYNMLAEIHAAS